MTPEIARIALTISDRNRFHPYTPVLNPGWALVGPTRKAKAGKLDVTGSIYAIWNRADRSTQPKAAA